MWLTIEVGIRDAERLIGAAMVDLDPQVLQLLGDVQKRSFWLSCF